MNASVSSFAEGVLLHTPIHEPAQTFKIKRLYPGAFLPTRAEEGAAGYDLYCDRGTAIHGGDRGLVATGIAVQVPDGYYGRIAPRSGLALKKGILVLGGVVDASYRGEVGVILFNSDIYSHSFERGERIAQLILTKIITPPIEEVEELEETARGADGFGSTGQ